MGEASRAAEKLCEELMHNAGVSGNRPLECRLADIAVWFYKNVGFIPPENLTKRQLFLEKAFWNQIELNALLLERLHEQKSGSKSLWLPAGLDVHGELKRYK
jgi:hypothetical protein